MPAFAWTPWDQKEADLTANCAGVYSAASYAIREYKYKRNDRQEDSDHFQRLSNILGYFASNSGYEKKMQKQVTTAKEKYRKTVDEKETVHVLYDDIERCDSHVDRLHELYTQ